MATDFGGAEPAAAQRLRRTNWRDARLWIGVALVAASIVIGAVLFSTADNTVRVWGVAEDLAAGTEFNPEELTPLRVHFDDGAASGHYFLVADGEPEGAVLTRAVGDGELLPRDALAQAENTETTEVPLSVEREWIPPSVGPGDQVEVWVTRPESKDEAERVLTDVTVLQAPALTGEFGGQTHRQLVVAVPDEQRPEIARTLAAADSGSIVIARSK